MLRFRIARLLREREEAEGRAISWREVGQATGISPEVLSSLASPRGAPPTNTRFLDALCRFFRVGPGELLELYPALDDEPRCDVNELYPGGRRPPPPPRPGQ
jgi:DNA-binding Xre family transcriptional regulator